jgi:hypothetical protein
MKKELTPTSLMVISCLTPGLPFTDFFLKINFYKPLEEDGREQQNN